MSDSKDIDALPGSPSWWVEVWRRLSCVLCQIRDGIQNIATPPATATVQTRYCDPDTCEHVATVLDICIVPISGPSTEVQKIKGPGGSELASVPAGAVECSECEDDDVCPTLNNSGLVGDWADVN